MKKVLAPSMLAADFSKLGEQFHILEEEGTVILHVDIMDGLFVPSISFGMPVVSSVRKCTKMLFDVHMMVQDPERYVEEFKNCGADCITIHVEACKDPATTLRKIKEMGVAPSIAVNPETPIAAVEPYLPLCEQVLVMSVHPGFGGQKYIPETDDKLRELAALREKLGLNFYIEVDGGIGKDNIAHVVECGADILVAGSAVFRDDIAQNVRDLNAVLAQYDED